MGLRLILCNCPPEHAAALGTQLVAEKLVACVNIIEGVRSLYLWKGELVDEREHTLLAKTAEDRVAEVEARIAELHPYEVPEIVVLEPHHASDAYVQWVEESTRVQSS